jgi:hypothetical protein
MAESRGGIEQQLQPQPQNVMNEVFSQSESRGGSCVSLAGGLPSSEERPLKKDQPSRASSLPLTTEGTSSRASLPLMEVDESFLSKQQAHASALTAFGDLFDNGYEAGAKTCWVDVETRSFGRGRPAERILRLTDDGHGMSEGKLRQSMMSIGNTDKSMGTGKHYGFGSKTSIPRICSYALLVTARDGRRSVLLISTEFSKALGASSLMLPLCSWEMGESGEWMVIPSTSKETPLEYEVRQLSLKHILECDGCPYGDTAALLHEFDGGSLANGHGTRLVMWRLNKDLDLSKTGDIRVPTRADALLHERSLRAYAEVLYLKVGTEIEPSMQIIIKGKPVAVRDWAEEAYLHHLRAEYTLGQPKSKDVLAQFGVGERGAKSVATNANAKLVLGYPISVKELARITSMRSHEEGQSEAKASLKEHTGIFFYHKGRLTRALEWVKQQYTKNGEQQTSLRRITQMGIGLTGFVLENYVVQTHNKASYVDAKLFNMVLEQASEKAKEHLRLYVTPAYSQVKGLLPASAPRPALPAPSPSVPPKKAPPKEKVSIALIRTDMLPSRFQPGKYSPPLTPHHPLVAAANS